MKWDEKGQFKDQIWRKKGNYIFTIINNLFLGIVHLSKRHEIQNEKNSHSRR